MTLEETKRLLLAHNLEPNKLLGQNFIIEPAIYPKLVSFSYLSKSDVVLDVGAGFGFLANYMSDKCRLVLAVEKDRQVASVLKNQVKNCTNVKVIIGDVLKTELPSFNKIIALPPYYLSSKLVTWLLERSLDCALLVVQKEFAQKLIADIGTDNYGWLTVVTYHKMQAEIMELVPKELFFPQPDVDSVILRLKTWIKSPFNIKNEKLFRQMTKWLFTQRNKKLYNAVTPFIKDTLKVDKQTAAELASTLPFKDNRARELAPEDFGVLADALSR